MPHHRLADGISFCDIEGRLVLLDLARDRYFSLGGETERAFRSLLDDPGCVNEADLARLRASRLIRSAEEREPIAAASETKPTRSLVEQRGLGSARFSLLPEIAARLVGARLSSRSGRLLGTVATLRRAKALGRRDSSLVELLVPSYLASRRLLPIAPNCLRDSLALGFFLARRGAPFELVFGVKLAPFAAHCWLQSDDLVLNDSLDSVSDFRPILVT